MSSVRALAKRILPPRFIDGYRRRRALRSFLSEIERELYDRQLEMHVEDIEGKVLARRPDITDRLTKDLLARTDLVLQELDRKIEGLRARHASELRALRADVAALRSSMEALVYRLQASTGNDGAALDREAPASAE